MAMLITPERSPMQPASAPRMSGIDAVSVFCSRLTTFTGMSLAQLPVSAQQSRETMKNNSTAPMLSRLAQAGSSTVARIRPRRIEAAPRM
jgi:hypothetical protein